MAELLEQVRAGLAAAGDPRRAVSQQAYMKSQMPYHGVTSPGCRAVFTPIFAQLDLSTRERWTDAVHELWRGAEFREERYAAVALTGVRAAEPYQTPQALGLYEEMIVTGAWWDFVDPLASRRVGGLLTRDPEALRPAMLAWSRDRDMWKRRTSILCQLSFKTDTDLELLTACIQPSLGSPEFFLRKAIGWALRQYAWTDPEWVSGYVWRARIRAQSAEPPGGVEECRDYRELTPGCVAVAAGSRRWWLRPTPRTVVNVPSPGTPALRSRFDPCHHHRALRLTTPRTPEPPPFQKSGL